MNNRWRRLAYLEFKVRYDEDYKYIERLARKNMVYNARLNKPKSFRKGAKHYANKKS